MIGIDICSVRIGFVCRPDLIERLISERYHAYLTDAPPEIIVRLAWREPDLKFGDDNDRNPNIHGYDNQGVYNISSPTCKGRIDPILREAELSLTTIDAINDFDYFLRIVLVFGLFRKGGFLLHSAGIIRADKAFLFFGKSGSGKSTVASYSRGHTILSDDLVGVIPALDGVVAYSTPFWNPGWEIHGKAQAQISGIYRLVKSSDTFIEPLKDSLAISEMIGSIPVIPFKKEYCAELIPIIQDVMNRVRVRYLHFKKDDSFWQLIIQELA